MKTLLIIRTILYSYGLPGAMFAGVAVAFFPYGLYGFFVLGPVLFGNGLFVSGDGDGCGLFVSGDGDGCGYEPISGFSNSLTSGDGFEGLSPRNLEPPFLNSLNESSPFAGVLSSVLIFLGGA